MTDLAHPMQASRSDALQDLLDLEEVELGLFRSCRPGESGMRLFGGEVCAQALVAAERTVPRGNMLHSLHAYFLRPGSTGAHIVYCVERPHDGRTFQRRRVTALQHGKPILSLEASFTADRGGTIGQMSAPTAPPPEDCESMPPMTTTGWALHPTEVFDIRPIPAAQTPSPRAAHDMWFRPRRECGSNRVSAAALLTYLSDYRFISAVLRAVPRAARLTSLDHVLWLHNDVRFDDWLYFAKTTPAAGPLRALAEGRIFHRDGTLIATVAQEGIIQDGPPPREL